MQDDLYDIESFGDSDITESEQIEKKLNRLPYPAITYHGYSFYINAKAAEHIKQDKVNIFKAKIRGDYYLCIRGTDDNRGFKFRWGHSHLLYAPRILDAIGLPSSVRITERKCAYIPNGIAMKIN